LPTKVGQADYRRLLPREWKDGDSVSVEFEMPLRVVSGDHGNQGKVVVTRGPLVLAADEGSNPDRKPITAVSIPNKPGQPDARIESAALPGGLFTVLVPACAGEGGHTLIMLKMVPFAIVGVDGSAYQVWYPVAEPNCGQ
jgi:hypothetical protein